MRLLHLGLLERELLLLLLLLLDWRWLSQLRPRILFELLLSKIIVSGLLVEYQGLRAAPPLNRLGLVVSLVYLVHEIVERSLRWLLLLLLLLRHGAFKGGFR